MSRHFTLKLYYIILHYTNKWKNTQSVKKARFLVVVVVPSAIYGYVYFLNNKPLKTKLICFI